MPRPLVVILLINIISCFIVRKFIHRGRMNILNFKPSDGQPKDRSVLIAGMMNQPHKAFELLSNVRTEQMIYCNFSVLGWNARNSAKQIDKCDDLINVPLRVFAISVGEKVAQEMSLCNQIVSINPCPHPSVLQKKLRIVLPPVAVLLQLLVFFLGWIAVLPVIPADDTPYSIALLADQLWEISMNRKTYPHNKGITSLILSRNDEFLDNEKIKKFYEYSYRGSTYIDSMHARTGDLEYAKEYDAAIAKFLK